MSTAVRTEHTIRYVVWSVETPCVIGDLHKAMIAMGQEAAAQHIDIGNEDWCNVTIADDRIVLTLALGVDVSDQLHTYRRGHASLDLETLYLTVGEHPAQAMLDCTFGVQVHDDGRVWVCINGSTFLWFKPNGKAITDD